MPGLHRRPSSFVSLPGRPVQPAWWLVVVQGIMGENILFVNVFMV